MSKVKNVILAITNGMIAIASSLSDHMTRGEETSRQAGRKTSKRIKRVFQETVVGIYNMPDGATLDIR